jgi:hypothetical protein
LGLGELIDAICAFKEIICIGMDHQYSVVEYLVLWFRLRIGNQSFFEKDMSSKREISFRITLK